MRSEAKVFKCVVEKSQIQPSGGKAGWQKNVFLVTLTEPISINILSNRYE